MDRHLQSAKTLRALGLPGPVIADILKEDRGPKVCIKVETDRQGKKTLEIGDCRNIRNMDPLTRYPEKFAEVSYVSLGTILDFLGPNLFEGLIMTRLSGTIDLDWCLKIMEDNLPNIQCLRYQNGHETNLVRFLQGLPRPGQITRLTLRDLQGFGTTDPQVLFGRMPQLRELQFHFFFRKGSTFDHIPQNITDDADQNLMGNMIQFLPQLDTLIFKGTPVKRDAKARLKEAILAHPNLKFFTIIGIRRRVTGTITYGISFDNQEKDEIFHHLLLNRAKAHLAQRDQQKALATVRFHVPLLFELLRYEMDPSVYANNAANNLRRNGPWEHWFWRHYNTSKAHQARLEEQNKNERLDPSSMFIVEEY